MSVIATLALAMLIQKAYNVYNESTATAEGTKNFVSNKEMEDLEAAKTPTNHQHYAR
jgi:hypothetical protein